MASDEIEQKEVKIDKYRLVLPKKWRNELGINKDTLLQELYRIGEDIIEFRKVSDLDESMELPGKHISVFGTVDDIGRIKISSEIRDFIDLNDEKYKYLLKRSKGIILLIKKKD
ncbi:MAG: hypothetical protein ACTSR3_18230 [Candidatus Helarchaeota archaeon]